MSEATELFVFGYVRTHGTRNSRPSFSSTSWRKTSCALPLCPDPSRSEQLSRLPTTRNSPRTSANPWLLCGAPRVLSPRPRHQGSVRRSRFRGPPQISLRLLGRCLSEAAALIRHNQFCQISSSPWSKPPRVQHLFLTCSELRYCLRCGPTDLCCCCHCCCCCCIACCMSCSQSARASGSCCICSKVTVMT